MRRKSHCKVVSVIVGLVSALISALVSTLCYAEAKLLVDFGATAQGNVFNTTDFPGWHTVQLSSHTDYTGGGPEGLTMVSGEDKYDSWQSIGGPEMALHPGDTIVITWYNATGGVVSLWRPLISFEDQDNPSATVGEPQWYAMDKYGSSMSRDRNVNYLQDGSTVQTVYTITSSETAPGTAPPSAGNRSFINICNRNSNYKGLILDKIEIVKAEESTPLGVMNVQAVRDVKLPHGKIHLSWDSVSPVGGVAIDHYRIYRNDHWVGRSEVNQFADANLECGTSYTYKVEVVNIFRNRGGVSQAATLETSTFSYREGVIVPNALTYLGAFRLPTDTQGSSWDYRRGQLAYYPDGDPDNVDGDQAFPGSLYAAGNNKDKMAAEISIPQPVITTNTDELPMATTLQDFHQIKPENISEDNYISIGLTYLTQNKRFYSTFYYWYNVSFTKRLTHGAFTPDFSAIYGGWWIGDSAEHRNPPYDGYVKIFIRDS